MSLAPSLSRKAAPSSSEYELVAAVRHGDDHAFEVLYDRYADRIHAYVAGMLRDPVRAEDIAQDVFIAALRRLRDTERPIAFRPWIYEIAKNACIDEFRRTRRMREISLDSQSEQSPVLGLAASTPTPQAAAESKQRLDHLRGAFGGLSESHHRILVMREFDGLSYSEIGDRTGMTRPMVQSALFRARKRLGEEYQEIVSGRRCQAVQQLIDTNDSVALPSLGIREKRRLARHLAHCQPCRRHAHLAGIDIASLKPRRLVDKVAALIPLPLLWRRRRSAADSSATTRSWSHQIAVAQSLPTLARIADASSYPALGRAVAAAVAIAVGSGSLMVGGAPRPVNQKHRIASNGTAAIRFPAVAASSLAAPEPAPVEPGLTQGGASLRQSRLADLRLAADRSVTTAARPVLGGPGAIASTVEAAIAPTKKHLLATRKADPSTLAEPSTRSTSTSLHQQLGLLDALVFPKLRRPSRAFDGRVGGSAYRDDDRQGGGMATAAERPAP